MKQTAIKATALVLSAGILFGIGATAVSAQKKEAESAEKKPTVTAAPTTSGVATAKDETVYVFTGADGSAQKVLVSTFLENGQKADTLEDLSHLSQIENVKGDESFAAGENGKLTWNAAGNDIYYQGVSEEKAPVEMSIHYTLDGKEISPEELAGKTGKVTIRFDYRNNQYETVRIDGKDQKIYVPFTMLTAVMLDTEVFRNVTVKNGKLVNFGNQIAVVGVAFPGAQENLGISREDLELPDYVEITADAESFEMESTMTLATTALLSGLDGEELDTADLKDRVHKLTDGMNQLMDGSSQLSDGLNTLLTQADVLVKGVDQLSTGASQLQTGAADLKNGASQLYAGASQLSGGLNQLNANSAALNGGAKQVFDTLLSTANTQLASAGLTVPTLTIQNYAEVLNGVIASLDETAVYESALKQVTDGVNARRGEIEAAVTAVVQEKVQAEVTAQVTAGVQKTVEQAVKAQEAKFRAAVILQATGMTPEAYQAAVEAGAVSQEQQAAVEAAVQAAMTAEITKQMESDGVKQQIAAMTQKITAEKMASAEIKAMIAENTELQVQKTISDMMASDEVQAKLQAAAEGAQAVISLKASLDSYNSFYLGLIAYTSGVADAAAGAKSLTEGMGTLKNGTDALAAGTGELVSGIGTMKGKMPALIEGVTALRDGSLALKEGLTQLMTEGIQKIADLAEEDLENLTARLTATVDAAKDYTSFSGVGNGTEGTVKFIYKTDAVLNEH